MRLEVHSRIAEVGPAWDALAPRGQVGLERRHLSAIERSGINAIEPFYILAYEGDQPVGIAYCFLFDLDLGFLDKDLSPDTVRALRAWHPGFMRARVIEFGFLSGLGETFAARDGRLGAVARAAAREMERIGRERQVDFVLIRDMPHARYAKALAGAAQDGYQPLLGFPIARMALPWSSFDEYLKALKGTSRYRVRHMLSQCSTDLESEVLPSFAEHAPRLAELWRQVHRRAKDYGHEELNEAYFAEIDRQLGERSRVVALKRRGQIVAFSLCLLGDEEYFSSHAGLDYDQAGDDNLHFTLSIAVLKDALASGAAVINRGVTTYDPKFALGFEADPQVYLVKHLVNPQLTVSVARRLQDAIPQPENVHQPFPNQDISTRPDLRALAAQLGAAREARPGDVFAKVFAYDRANSVKLGGVYSFFPPFEAAQGPITRRNGRDVVMLGANAYLGLGTHPALAAAAKAAIEEYGTGSSGSPLLNGTLDIHVDLARALAAFMGKDDALLFSTGYQTNVGVVSTILGKDDVVIMDRLDHASLVDGARMAGADIVRFRHNDMDSLEHALKSHPGRSKFVVVDSVYSMEGAIADLPTIVELAQRYGARTMVDEAHAVGVLGPGGRGACELLGVLDKVDIVMGSMSKALAAVGGFVVASAPVIDYLRHVARSHLFSTSLPPPAIAAARAALEIVKNEPERRRRVLHNAEYFSRHLEALGYDAPYRHTAIVPVHCGKDVIALGAFKWLLERGVFVNPVLDPAVPKGRELLRTSYMATHTEEMLDRALEAFAAARTPAFPARRVAPVLRAQRAQSLTVRPLVLLPVADRRALSRHYLDASGKGVLRVPGFTRLGIGQPVDCGISFGVEGVILQSQGCIVSKCLEPRAGRPLGIDVELLASEAGARQLLERLVHGEDMLPNRRRAWRYHAAINVEYPVEDLAQIDTLDDISAGGAAVRSARAVEFGARLPMRLRIPAFEPIDVTGEVCWRRSGGSPSFGVQFLFSTTAERKRVRDLIGRIQAAMAETPLGAGVIQ